MFAPGGILSKARNFEYRPGQQQTAQDNSNGNRG